MMISVVIPVKNRANLIGRCLDSIKSQTYRPMQVIVVDNGSTDNTKEAVANWSRLNCDDNLQLTLLCEPIPGAAEAREKGLSAVFTEWALFFDSDDEMLPDMIGSIATEIDNNPHLDLIYWNCLVRTGNCERKRVLEFGNRSVWDRHIYNGLLSTQSFAVKTEFLHKAGGWNTKLKGWDDWELGVRLLLENPKIKEIPKPLAVIHPQEDSITGTDYNSKAGIWEEAIDASEQAVKSSSLGISERCKLIRMINYRRTNLAALYKRENHKELSSPLLRKSLEHPTNTPLRKILLRMIYTYTSLGGRMAYLFWR